jgi:molecular chaperone DnaK (HSP70)
MIPELIAFSIFIVMFVAALAANIRLIYKNKKLRNQMIQFALDKAMLLEHIEKNSGKANSIEQSEGFLKFVSDSRDWAFKYIEDVQGAIVEFNSAVASKDDEKIESALNNLKSFLPDNEEENNKINKEKNEN